MKTLLERIADMAACVGGNVEEVLLDAAKEINALRAEIAAMKQQVPICRAEDLSHAQSLLPCLGLKPEDPLYTLPGAQSTPSVPEGCWKQAVEEIADEGFGAVFKRLISDRAAMLAAAQEDKP